MPTRAFAANPLQFMRDNVLLVDQVADQSDTHNTYRLFRLEQLTGVTIRNRPNGGVYSLLDSVEGDTNFASYWCPYQANNHLGAFLKLDAKCMFTAVMDGCSLGVGSATTNGSRMVYHANNMKAGMLAVPVATTKDKTQKRLNAQIGAQAQELSKLNVPTGNVISPKMYAGKKGKVTPFTGLSNTRGFAIKYKSTTFGLRWDQKGWLFYTLRYRWFGKTEIEHGGLKSFTPGD